MNGPKVPESGLWLKESVAPERPSEGERSGRSRDPLVRRFALIMEKGRGFAVHGRNAVQMTNEFDPPILATEFAIGDDTQADPLWGRSHPGSLRRRPHVDRRRRPLHSARADALRRCCRGEAGCRQCRRAVRLLCHQRSIPFRRTPHGRRASLGTRAVSNLGRADDRLAVFEERLRHVERPEAVKAGDRDQHRKGQRREIDRALEAGRY
jgi:hypothetical protein